VVLDPGALALQLLRALADRLPEGRVLVAVAVLDDVADRSGARLDSVHVGDRHHGVHGAL
jgi:hypothetical protein